MKSLFPFIITSGGILKRYIGFGKDIIISENVSLIGDNAFYKCDTIRSVIIPKGVIVDCRAFHCCKNLREVYLPEGLKEIKFSTFQDCSLLKKIVIPESLLLIGSYAFESCSSLEEVHLPEGLREIGDGAFNKCVRLKKINLPETLEKISSTAFDGCYSLELDSKIKDKLSNEKNRTNNKRNFIPDNLNITDNINQKEANYIIQENELAKCNDKNSNIIVPEGITAIYSYAFYDVKTTLKNIVIPEGIQSIRANTFQDCYNLESVKLPQSLRAIHTKAFANCTSLKEINLHKKIIDVAKDAFLGCNQIKLPSHIINSIQNPSAASGVFFRNLPDKTIIQNGVIISGGRDIPKNLKIPAGIRVIEKGAFSFFKIKNVYISDGLLEIGKGAFAFCDEIKSVHLPETLISIEEDAFSCCSELENINFPESIQYIGKNAFNKCNKINFPKRIIELIERNDVSKPKLENNNLSKKIKNYEQNRNIPNELKISFKNISPIESAEIINFEFKKRDKKE